MSEELYEVAVDFNRHYAGRDQFGRIRLVFAGAGTLMTIACAQALVDKFKSKYHRAKIVEVLRNDRDDLPATSLAELGEIAGLDTISEFAQKLISDGFSREDILAAVNRAVRQ